jgi:hypothetical protein
MSSFIGFLDTHDKLNKTAPDAEAGNRLAPLTAAGGRLGCKSAAETAKAPGYAP